MGKKKSKQEEGNNKDQKGNRNPIKKKKKKPEKINVTNSWFLEKIDKIDVISKAPLRQRGDPNKQNKTWEEKQNWFYRDKNIMRTKL